MIVSKVCIICGGVYTANSGNNKHCPSCKAKPCPQCHKLDVLVWSNGVCESCNGANHYKANLQHHVDYSREYYLAYKEKVKAKWLEYRLTHPDVIKAGTIRYIAEHRDEITLHSLERRRLLRIDMVAAYGGSCSLCGESHTEFLCIDHIRNNGQEERKRLGGGGVHFYRKLQLAGWPKSDYRLLCCNCNMSRMLIGKMSVEQNPSQVKYTRKIKAEMLLAYGSKCVCCGESDPVLLALDHKYGGGHVDRKNNLRGRLFYTRLKAVGWPKDSYRLLCHNCNMSRGFFGYCPHEDNAPKWFQERVKGVMACVPDPIFEKE